MENAILQKIKKRGPTDFMILRPDFPYNSKFSAAYNNLLKLKLIEEKRVKGDTIIQLTLEGIEASHKGIEKWVENKVLDEIKKREFILTKDTNYLELNALRSLEDNGKVYELEKRKYRVVPGKTSNKTIKTAANPITADGKSKEKVNFFTYDNIVSKIKNNKIGTTILLSIVGIIGFNELSDAIENIEKFNYFNAEVKSIDTIQKPITNIQPDFTNQILLDSLKLPYLKKVPILDKGIFIKYSYNNLVIGGVNIDSLNLNARTREGEPLPFRYYNQTLETNIKLQPYIELNYKGNYYSLEIVGSHSSFYCTLKENIHPILSLN